MPKGLAGIIYGKEGLGKTSLGLRFPGPVFCKSIYENGYAYLEDIGVPDNTTNDDIRSFEQLVDQLKKQTSGTFLVDSLKGLQAILFEYVRRKYYDGSEKEFNSYSSGARKESVSVLLNFLDLCSQKNAAGVHTIFLGHMGTQAMSNALGPDIVCHVISMEDGDRGGIRSTITAWAGFIFFLNLQVEITRTTEKEKQTIMEGKVNSEDNRINII